MLIAIFSSLLSVPPLAHTRSLAHSPTHSHSFSSSFLILSHTHPHCIRTYTYIPLPLSPRHPFLAYVVRGFFIGFTGTICKKERGAPLRALLPHLPLDRIMIETDAPYMGFVKGRRRSEPADVVGVAEKLAETLGVSLASVAAQTTASARSFFRL